MLSTIIVHAVFVLSHLPEDRIRRSENDERICL